MSEGVRNEVRRPKADFRRFMPGLEGPLDSTGSSGMAGGAGTTTSTRGHEPARHESSRDTTGSPISERWWWGRWWSPRLPRRNDDDDSDEEADEEEGDK